MTVLHVMSTDLSMLRDYIQDVITKAPRLFERLPLVLDCSAINGQALSFFRPLPNLACGCLLPVAVQGGDAYLESLAEAQGLAILRASANQDQDIQLGRCQPKSKAKVEDHALKSKLITKVVRSGQQLVGKTVIWWWSVR